MIVEKFTACRKPAYYEVKVSVNRDNITAYSYSFGMVSKAPYDAIISALRASLKDSYTLEVEARQKYHSEYSTLETACALLDRLRFVEYSTKTVEKIVYVTETIQTEL